MGLSLAMGWREVGLVEWSLPTAAFAAPAPVQPAAAGTTNQDFSVWLYYVTSAAFRTSQPCLSVPGLGVFNGTCVTGKP